jgi:serine/threonine protein kinase
MLLSEYIGEYRIVSEVGHGGSSRVYKAYHYLRPREFVAIKVFVSQRYTKRQLHEQFRRETAILKRFCHANVLHLLEEGVYESDQYGALPYLVTPYYHTTLRDRLIEEQFFTPREALFVLGQICEGLMHIHWKNSIHCDLKPDNILFSARNEVVIADFGIAQDASSGLVYTDQIAGTYEYMAPEQFEGKPELKSDLFALACIAYEMLTGYKPFIRPDEGVGDADRYVYISPDAPDVLNEELPAALTPVFLQALAADPDQRYANPAHFLRALEVALQPVLAPARRYRAETQTTATVLRRISQPLWQGLSSVASAVVAYKGRQAVMDRQYLPVAQAPVIIPARRRRLQVRFLAASEDGERSRVVTDQEHATEHVLTGFDQCRSMWQNKRRFLWNGGAVVSMLACLFVAYCVHAAIPVFLGLEGVFLLWFLVSSLLS